MLRTPRISFVLPLIVVAACSGGGGGSPISRLTLLEFSGTTLNPAFAPDTLAYTARVLSAVDAVTLNASANGATSGVAVNGASLGSGSVATVLPLSVGANDFAITLAGADGAPTRTYSVTLTRAEPPVLSRLAIAGAVLAPAFDPATTSYSATVGYLLQATTITPDTTGADLTIAIDGTPSLSGAPTPLTLAVGSNEVVVRVGNSAGEQRDYTIHLQRQTVATFAQEAFIKAANATSEDRFGNSIAIDGDTLVVGATFEESNATGINGTGTGVALTSGAAYVFVRSGGTWTQQAYIKVPAPGGGVFFGQSVALQGDLLAIGQMEGGAAYSGAVYLYARNGSTWTESGSIEPIDGDPVDHFAFSMALRGDTLVVGAPDEDSSTPGVDSVPDENASNSGAAYVFTRSGGVWRQTAYLKASNPGVDDRFGYSVAFAGDTIVVGAPYERSTTTGIDSTPNDDGFQIGAAYVFGRDGTSWSQLAYVKSSSTLGLARFGFSVAIQGETIAVGEPGGASLYQGDVQLFTRTGTSVTAEVQLDGPPIYTGYFGCSVALVGDTLAVGQERYSEPPPAAQGIGAAYVYVLDGGTWVQQTQVLPLHPTEEGHFGSAVALSGDALAIAEIFEGTATTGINNPPTGSALQSGAVYVIR